MTAPVSFTRVDTASRYGWNPNNGAEAWESSNGLTIVALGGAFSGCRVAPTGDGPPAPLYGESFPDIESAKTAIVDGLTVA